MVDKLSVKELEDILDKRGVAYNDCFEKSDLVAKVNSTEHLGTLPKDDIKKGGITQKNVTLGGLTCEVVQNCEDPKLVVILCHGFGANAADLVPLSRLIFQLHTDIKIQFVFPNAPISMGGSNLAWWNIDLQSMLMKFMTGQIQELFDQKPPGLDQAREKIDNLILELQSHTKLPLSKFIIGGFSQGAMLSIDTSLRLKEPPGAVCAFSGTIMCQPEWTALAKNRQGLCILQSHGSQDTILPYIIGVKLNEFLQKNGLNVEFVQFVGGHTIPPQALQKFMELLQKVLLK